MKNKNAVAFQSNGLNSRTNTRTNHVNNTPNRDKLQTISPRFVCDECARPLHLYGENFIESYTNGKVNVLRCLCDLHADEMGVNK